MLLPIWEGISNQILPSDQVEGYLNKHEQQLIHEKSN